MPSLEFVGARRMATSMLTDPFYTHMHATMASPAQSTRARRALGPRGIGDADGVGKITVQLHFCLLLEAIAGNDLECLLHIDGLLGACFKVLCGECGFSTEREHMLKHSTHRKGPLLHTPSLGTLGGDLTLALLHVHLVAQQDKGKGVGIARTSLQQEFIAPRVQRLKAAHIVDVVAQDAAICSTVECDAQALEALLAGRVPDLYGDERVVHQHLFGEEVGANGGLVAVAEFLVDVLVHQGGFADATVTEDDDFELASSPAADRAG
jgi:hypothetical protein